MTLRFSRWQAKRQLSPAKYESLTAAVSKILLHTISVPQTELDVAWARAFVRSYAQDAARHTLQVLNDQGALDDRPTSHEVSIRKFTLQLAGRLAKVQGGLDASVLVDLAVAYGTGNTTSLEVLFKEAYNSTPALLREFQSEVLPDFKAALDNAKGMSPSSIRNTSYILAQLLNNAPEVLTLFAEDREFVLTLARSYQAGLDNLAASRGGMNLEFSDTTTTWRKDWLYTKTHLLDTFHAIIQFLLQSKLSKDEDCLISSLFMILELPSSSAAHNSTPATPFVSQPLLADYQYAFNLSKDLVARFRDADDARVDVLAASLAELSPSWHGTKPAGGLWILLKEGSRARSSDSKGKAKATNQEPEYETVLELGVSQVLDIFPSYTPQHIRRCLKYPDFDGDAEKLISSLLEGTLPSNLANDVDAVHDSVPPVEESEFIKDRRNAWDDDAMDFSKLRIGKIRDDADAILQDRSFIDQMKADIIRRVEESSEEEVGRPQEQIVAFEEELDDDIESIVDKGVKVSGDGEESDEDGESDGAEIPSPEAILELAYIEDPKFFDRDAATRRSKTRTDLKAKTGWGDEQIEGWRIMLERNPKKDKILQKHEFAGNVPLVPNTNANEPGPSGTSRGGPSYRGRGDARGRGRGVGRGGEGGSGGDTARGRAWKDKNKARNANHNRKRGHDKKIARGGA